jgi:hypothetical protein
MLMKGPRPANKIGRKRRVMGWTLLTLGVLVAGVWVASCYWEAEWICPASGVQLRWGTVSTYSVSFSPTGPPPASPPGTLGFAAAPVDPHNRKLVLIVPRNDVPSNYAFQHLFVVAHYRSPDAVAIDGYFIALWPIPLLLWTPAALLLRSGILARRRAIAGTCSKCGYSFAGLAADAPCPECGKNAK